MNGLYLKEPHGRFIFDGGKTIIATNRRLPLEGDRAIVSKENGVGLAFGVAHIGKPALLNPEQFDAIVDRHRVPPADRRRWWPESNHLYAYPIQRFEPFAHPRPVVVEPGVQMDMGEVAFAQVSDKSRFTGIQNSDTMRLVLSNLDSNLKDSNREEVGEMPWTVADPPRPAKNWTKTEKKKCVTAANAVLQEGGKEQDAIFACIRAAGKTRHPGGEKGLSYLSPNDYVAAEELVTGFIAAQGEKARGEGQGVDGPRQGDSGAEVCVCPKCKHEIEHERGTPCNETKCPKCGTQMEGKSEPKEKAVQLTLDVVGKKENAKKDGDMGDSDPGVCTCPNCGAESEKETDEPCSEQQCPECGSAMRGGGSEDEKAIETEDGEKQDDVDAATSVIQSLSDDDLASVHDKLSSALPSIAPGSPNHAQFEQVIAAIEAERQSRAEESTGKSILWSLKAKVTGWLSDISALLGRDEPTTVYSFKSLAGKDRTWFVLWPTNAYRDRDEEFFRHKAIHAFVDRHDADEIKGRAMFWHIPGSEFGTIWEQAIVADRFLVQLGTYDDAPIGNAFKSFFQKYPDSYPVFALNGWGESHGYNYIPADRKADGIYNWFETKETSVLPTEEASNPHNPRPYMEVKMNDKQKEAIQAIGEETGVDLLALITKNAEGQRKELDDKVEHKSKGDSEKAADDTEKTGKKTEETGDDEKTFDEKSITALVTAVTEALQLDALSEKMTAMDTAISTLTTGMEEVKSRLNVTEVADEKRLAQKLEAAPRLNWFRASQASDTVLTKDDKELKAAKPKAPNAVVGIASAISSSR